MPLTPDQAAASLRDVEDAQRRSSNAYGYRLASPHLILWGVIWLIGYGVPWFMPKLVAWIWPPLATLGIIASFAIGIALKPKAADKSDRRFWQTAVALFCFVWAQVAVLPDFSDRQAAVYFPILVALMYALTGIWTRGLRITFLGAAIGALALAGYFLLPQLLLPWMAVVGGGGLILGGLWLRAV